MTPMPVGAPTGSESPPQPTLPGPTGKGADESGLPHRSGPDLEPQPIEEPESPVVPDAPGRADGGSPRARSRSPRRRRSSFDAWLAGVGVLAAGIQALFIHAMAKRSTLPPAAWYDTVQARALVRGYWFIDPFGATSGAHLLVPTASHPPLPTLLLAIADVASATGPTAHMVFLATVFVASVMLGGVTIRELVGERAGILAALVFATCPFLWVNPATVGPETTVIAVTTLLLFASVRFWARPTNAHAALVGLALGLAALTRTDLVALVVLVGLPLGLLVRSISWGTRLRLLVVMGALFLLVVGPWVGRNVNLYGHTVLLSEDYGPVVAGANCPTTTSGALEGWWSPKCLAAVPVAGQPTRVATDTQVRAARTYVGDHPGASIATAAARLGRVWNVYRPLQTADLESAAGRPAWVSRLGVWYFIALVPAALLGAVVLRRRRLLLFPFVALIVLASLTAVLAFGDPRFAVEADVALALLAGVALDAAAIRAVRRWSSGPGRHSPGGAVR